MDEIREALDDLMRYADTCELFLRETHPGKAEALRARVRKATEALAAKSVPVVGEPVALICDDCGAETNDPWKEALCVISGEYVTDSDADRQLAESEKRIRQLEANQVIYSPLAAIQFAIEQGAECLTFLRLWNEGEFAAIRREWPECPEEVFIGADPLATQQKKEDE